jgi:Mrp family chromosome partitioning ATPase/capsular polysaccharide biosynthesis protein
VSQDDRPARAETSLIDAVWQHRYAVAAVVLLASVAAYGLSNLQTPAYEATTRLFLADPGTQVAFREAARGVDPARYVPQQAERVESEPVLRRASELLEGRLTPAQVAARLSVEPDVGLALLSIAARGESPEQAVAVATAAAQAYQDVTQEANLTAAQAAVDQLQVARAAVQENLEATEEALADDPEDLVAQTRLNALSQQILDLEARAQQLAVDAAVLGSGVDLVENATLPTDAATPTPVRDAILAGLLAGAAASAAAFWWADRRQGTALLAQDAGAVLGVPLLGEIPEYEVSPRGDAIGPGAQEAYQVVLSAIDFELTKTDGSTVLLTSALPGEGKTATALQLALAGGHEGRRVVLVDADARQKSLSRRISKGDAPGLAELVQDEASIDDVAWAIGPSHGGNGGVQVIPVGRRIADPPALFRSAGFRKAMQEIRSRGVTVLLDAPPVLAVADASLAAAQVDGVVLVVGRGTGLPLLRELARRLSFVPTPVIGYVFNRSQAPTASYYGYGHGRDGGRDPLDPGKKE